MTEEPINGAQVAGPSEEKKGGGQTGWWVAIGCLGACVGFFVLVCVGISGELKGTNNKDGDVDSTAGSGQTMDCSGVANVPTSYMKWVEDAANRWIDGDQSFLIALIQTESSWKPNAAAKSSSATGLGQFIYKTASGMPEFVGGCDKKSDGKCVGRVWPGGNIYNPRASGDARFDPERSIYAVAHMLYTLKQQPRMAGKDAAEIYRIGYHTGGDAVAYAAKARFQKMLDGVSKGCTAVAGGDVSSPTGAGCNNVPIFRQCDSKWGNISYGCGNTTICSSACGPTSAAMVLKFYGVNVDPKTTAAYSLSNGHRVCNAGTAYSLFPAIAKKYGLKAATGLSWESVVNYINQGKPVIVSGKGSKPFTSGGHFVVLTCYDAKNKAIGVNDPNGGSKSRPVSAYYPESYIKNHHHSAQIIYK